jgi:hypothetical protein
MWYTFITIILLLYLIFKNIYILVIGGILIIFYYFNYKEGLTAAEKKALITAKTVKNIGVVKKTVKKVLKK